MSAVNLLNDAEFSATSPVKKDLMKTAGSNFVIVSLKTSQVILPHPEPYAVVFVVLQGEGTITSGTIEYPSSIREDVRGAETQKTAVIHASDLTKILSNKIRSTAVLPCRKIPVIADEPDVPGFAGLFGGVEYCAVLVKDDLNPGCFL